MTVTGTWDLDIATPIGRQQVVLELSGTDDDLRGVARAASGDVPLVDPSLTGDRLTWTQTITRPMRLHLAFDVTVHGDHLIGTSRAGRLPSSTVTGHRRAGPSAEDERADPAPASQTPEPATPGGRATATLLMVGLDPALVDAASASRTALPGMDAERVRAGVAASRDELRRLGLAVHVCLLDHGETAETVFRTALADVAPDLVMIGAGVRMDPSLTHLLEVLVRTTRELAPHATLCFNTGPTTTAEAVRRWWPAPQPLSPAVAP